MDEYAAMTPASSVIADEVIFAVVYEESRHLYATASQISRSTAKMAMERVVLDIGLYRHS
jgi:hypothetical protein